MQGRTAPVSGSASPEDAGSFRIPPRRVVQNDFQLAVRCLRRSGKPQPAQRFQRRLIAELAEQRPLERVGGDLQDRVAQDRVRPGPLSGTKRRKHLLRRHLYRPRKTKQGVGDLSLFRSAVFQLATLARCVTSCEIRPDRVGHSFRPFVHRLPPCLSLYTAYNKNTPKTSRKFFTIQRRPGRRPARTVP